MSLLNLPRRIANRLRRRLDPQLRLIDRVAAAKAMRASAPAVYADRPRVSLILLSFNHRRNIPALLDGFRRTVADELIVCEDGSIDGSERDWLRLLTRPNEFLIRSNDIHDSRAYNRAAALARGDIVCVLQDDDLPPASGAWVEQALGFFDRDPRLGILGGHQGWVLDLSAPHDRVRRRNVYGYREASRWSYVEAIPFRDPVSSLPFMFVQGVSIGPIFYRRDVFLELGGFNLDYSRPGEVGMLVDHELCLRAWLGGWRVGLYGPVPFVKYVGGQGTVMFGPAARSEGLVRNFNRIQREFTGRISAIDDAAQALNRQLGSPA